MGEKMFIKDSAGNRSLTATITYIAFIVVMVKVLFNNASIGSLNFGSIDSLSIAAILTPVLGSYTARRWGEPTGPSKEHVRQTNGEGRVAGS